MAKFRVIIKGIVQFEDKYLAVQKWYDDRIVDPYQWEFIDGELEFGETPDAAVIRLINEKTGLSVQINRPLYTWGFTAGDICTCGVAFLCDAPTDDLVLSEDYYDSKWITTDEISEVISNKAVVKDIENAGLGSDSKIDDIGKVDLFIEPMD